MPLIPALLLAAAAAGAGGDAPERVRFDRVDLVSEDPGTWLNYTVWDARAYAAQPAMRFVTQVKVVFDLPVAGVEGLSAGASLLSQSVAIERPILREKGLFWSAGLQTKLLLPAGAFGGVAWRHGRLRVGLGVSALSSATWARPDWSQWSVMPTLGLGVGRKFEP